MTDKARELLERVIAETDSSHFYSSEIDKEIRAYLAKPEVKREALSVDLIMSSFASRSYGFQGDNWPCFSAGVRFAEKHHGIGEE